MIDARVQDLLEEVGLEASPEAEATIVGRDPILGYRFPVGEAAAAAVARWDGQALEDALTEARQCGAMVRSSDEWLAHPQGRALADRPRVEIVKIGESEPEPLPAGDRPLSGVRVLDLTRILAGPTHARTLAEHGAEVLHIASPWLPNPDVFVMDTNHGKLS